VYDNTFAVERLVALQQAEIARATERWCRQVDALEARPEARRSRPARRSAGRGLLGRVRPASLSGGGARRIPE
jgi:hypothetical protein